MVDQREVYEQSYSNGGFQHPQEKKSGCLKYTAIGCAVVLLLAIVGGYFAYRGIKGLVSRLTEEYTSAQPIELPVIEFTEAEASAVMDRVKSFTDAINQNVSTQPLVLTSREINILINDHPDWKKLAGKVFVDIEGDRIKGQISLPLGEAGSMFEGRYSNGSAVFNISMQSDRLLLFLDSATVGDKSIPDEIMNSIRSRNLAEDAYKNPDVAPVLEKIESITVRDGNLIIVPKPFQQDHVE